MNLNLDGVNRIIRGAVWAVIIAITVFIFGASIYVFIDWGLNL